MHSPSIAIKHYQKSDPIQLLKLTQRVKLARPSFFESYLTPQQYIVLDYILAIKDDETRINVWSSLLTGNLSLEIIKIEEPQEVGGLEVVNPIETAADVGKKKLEDSAREEENNDDVEENKIDEQKEKEPIKSTSDDSVDQVEDFSDIDFEDLKQQLHGDGFINNLGLKLRYALWQCAVDPIFDNKKNDDSTDSYNLYTLDFEDEVDSLEPSVNTLTHSNETQSKTTEDDQYDDDYDDDIDNDTIKIDEEPSDEKNSNNMIESDVDIIHSDEQRNKLILDIKISKETLSKLRTNPTDLVLANVDKIYHSFEYDRETMLRRLKLEKSDQLIQKTQKRKQPDEDNSDTIEENDKTAEDKATNSSDIEFSEPTESKRPKLDTTTSRINVNLGIENLSLKYLLSAIREDKSKLDITDYNLKHLLLDIRKNRSKWTSDDRIGQEELYEACERVVLELRNYTEHSTPFLNKVSKREAPNYHEIIKKSMDLNTVLRKLKTFQYNSKQEFVDDIMLIWKNCLTYNSEPSHYLRGHAIAMQKKSLQLIPLIPNITIRRKEDVEREIEELDKKDDGEYEEDDEDEVAGSGRKGLNMGAHMLAKSDTPLSNEKGYEDEQVEDDMRIRDNASQKSKKVPPEDKIEKVMGPGKALPESEALAIEKDGNHNGSTFSLAGKSRQDAVSTEKNQSEWVNDESTKEEGLKSTLSDKSQLKQPIEAGSETDQPATNVTTTDIALNTHENVETEEAEAEAGARTGAGRDAEGEHETDGKDMEEDEVEDDDDDDEEEEEEEEMADVHEYLADADIDRDDIEISVWRSLTAKIRTELCVRRSEYFKNGELNMECEAFLKTPQKLKEFEQLYQEFKNQKDSEAVRNQIEQREIMKNGFGTVVHDDSVVDEEPSITQSNNGVPSNDPPEKSSIELDIEDSLFFREYDTGNVMPALQYKGSDFATQKIQEDEIIRKHLADGIDRKSIFLENVGKGLTPKVNRNIELIQKIRHICHKISLIRLLQNPVANPNSKANPANIIKGQYIYEPIDDNMDIDPVSSLETHNYRYDKTLMKRIMFKNISKIAMSNGFETTEPTAISMLTEVAEDYLSNLIRTLKVHRESNTINSRKQKDVIQMTLLENGIHRPDELYSYIEAEFNKKTNKLLTVKSKLETFLKDLLRPSLQELSERNFDDESQSFLTGDFTSELTGEDFFGFRELGLEREFGVLSNSVPLQLLTFQFQSTTGEAVIKENKLTQDELESVVYSKPTQEDVANSTWGIMTGVLKRALERSLEYVSKQAKAGNIPSDSQYIQNDDGTIMKTEILEDDEYISKKPTSRPRVPPTGKISTAYKNKPIADAYIIPLDDNSPETKETCDTLDRGFDLSLATESQEPDAEIPINNSLLITENGTTNDTFMDDDDFNDSKVFESQHNS